MDEYSQSNGGEMKEARIVPQWPTPFCQLYASLIGGQRYQSVTLTSAQLKRLGDFYGFKKSQDPLTQAGDDLAKFRLASGDGLRMMAVLSPHLNKGDDPVKLLVQLMSDAGWDVDYEIAQWANEGD